MTTTVEGDLLRRVAGAVRAPRVLGAVVATAAAILLVVASLPGTAAAHASLVSTDPPSAAVLDAAPDSIDLSFSEAVSVQPDGVRVLDGDARRMDLGTASASGQTVTSAVDDLPAGSYVVAWRVVSADGHPVAGAFTFSVRSTSDIAEDLADRAFAGSDDGRDNAIGGVLRAIVYLAVLGVGGLGAVAVLLRRNGDPPPVPRLAAAVAGAGAVAALAQLPLQASLITGRGWSSIAEAGGLRLAAGEGMGVSIGLIVLGLVAVALTGGLASTRDVRLTASIGAVVALVGLPLSGHTRTMDPKWLGYGADLAHVLAAAVWFGGLIALLRLVRHRRSADDLGGAATAVARFSTIAAASVAVVAVAGIVMGWMEVGGKDGLTGTSYGRLLLAKVAVIAAVLAGAWWNRTRFVPLVAGTDPEAVGDGHPSRWRTFDRVLRFEAIGIAVAIVITAALVNVTPGRVQQSPGIQASTVELGDGEADVVVDPARPGRNEIHVYVKDDAGRLDGSMEEVTVTLSLPSQEVPPFDASVVEIASGHYQVVNVDIPLAGDWTVTVTAKEDRFSVETVEVTIPIR